MKKLLIKLLTIVLSAVCCLGFIACNDADNGDGGSGALTKTQYATAFGSATGICKDYLTTPEPSAFSFSVSDSDLTEVNNPMPVYATIWFMDFLKNVCNTESFTLTDGYAECDIVGYNSNGGAENYKIRFKMSYEKASKTIKSCVYSQDFTNGTLMYLDFTVVYDFEANALTSFITKGCMGSNVDSQMAMYLDYQNSTLRELNMGSSAYLEMSNAMIGELTTHNQMTFGENLPDYSVQYNSANPYLQ
ncbi:MAG: hypothetical protein IJV95_00235 [Clostridia bacterium]|nr:hypothetical protein [Clostridia bacterium]